MRPDPTGNPPPPPPSGHPPRWAWWVGGIALPALGIIVTLIVEGGDSGAPAAAPAPPASPESRTEAPRTPGDGTSNPPLTGDTITSPAASPTSAADLAAPSGYTLREGRWGIAPGECVDHEQQMVDLDSGVSKSVTTSYSGRGEEVAGHEGAELVYFPGSCSGQTNYELRALTGRTAGLLRADAAKSFKDCKDAAGTGLGPMPLYLEDDREEHGFVPGAAVCAVTDQSSIAMAVVENISPRTGDASVTGPLYVWSKDS